MPALVALACVHTGMTRRDLGVRLGRDARNLGTRRPKLEIAVGLAAALGWPIRTLALASGDATPRPRSPPCGELRPSLHAAIGALDAGEPLLTVRIARKWFAKADKFSPELCLVWALALRELQRCAECDAIAALAVESARGGDARRRRVALAARRLREIVALERAVRGAVSIGGASKRSPSDRRRRPVTDATPTREGVARTAWVNASDHEIERWLSTHVAARWTHVTRVAARSPRIRSGRKGATGRGRANDGAWLVELLTELSSSIRGPGVGVGAGIVTTEVGGAIEGGALAALMLVVESILIRQRAMAAVDGKVLRAVSRALQVPLEVAVDPDSTMRWHDRMRLVRAEALRRRLVARLTGVAGSWAIGDAHRKLVIALIGRYPAFRRIGLRLLAETALTRR